MKYSEIDLFPVFDTKTPCCPPHLLLIIILSFTFFHKTYQKSIEMIANKKKAARFAPLLHSIFATLSSMFVIYNYTPVFTVPETFCISIKYCDIVFSVSSGYFLWDLYTSIHEKWGYDFIFHSMFCIFVFVTATFGQFMQRLAIFCLFQELSTVFLHTYIYCYYWKYDRIALFLQLCFVCVSAYASHLYVFCTENVL